MISRLGRHVVRGTQVWYGKILWEDKKYAYIFLPAVYKKEYGCSIGFQIPPSSSIEVTVDSICLSFSSATAGFGFPLLAGETFAYVTFFHVTEEVKFYLHAVLKRLSANRRHEGIWGSGFVAPHIRNLGSRQRRVVSFILPLLCPLLKKSKAGLDALAKGHMSCQHWESNSIACWYKWLKRACVPCHLRLIYLSTGQVPFIPIRISYFHAHRGLV